MQNESCIGTTTTPELTFVLDLSPQFKALPTFLYPPLPFSLLQLPHQPGATPSFESLIPEIAHTPTPSSLPTLGTDNSPARESSAGAIAGALVGILLVVAVAVLVVLLVVLMLRRRQKKKLHAVNTEERVLDNPVYAGTLSH